METTTAVSILVAEDDVIALKALALTLKMKYPKAVVHKAMDGRAGLEIFKAHQPDIVITDVNMPEMGGMLLVASINSIKQDTKCIVLTGDSGKLMQELAVGKGIRIDQCLDKPVNFHDLFSAIDKCIGEIATV